MNKLGLVLLLVALAIAAWYLMAVPPAGATPAVGDAAALGSVTSHASGGPESVPAAGATDAARAPLPAAPEPVALPAVCSLRGTLRDGAGTPVADAEVVVRNGYDLPFPVAFSLGARTGADGAFAFAQRVPAGSWRIEVRDRVVIAPRAVSIGAGKESQELDLQVEVRDEHAVIAGVVVDGQGLAVPGVWVEFRAPDGIETRVLDAADGRFVLRCPGQARGPVRLGWSHPEGHSGYDSTPIPWGTTNVRIEIGGVRRTPSAELDLLVVGPDSATPVEDYSVRGSWQPGLLAQGRHPGGRVRLQVGTPQELNLFVYPASAELLAAGPEPVRADGTSPVPVAVTLRRVTTLPVRVQRPDGTVVAGERVELLRPWPNWLDDRTITAGMRSVPLGDPCARGALQIDAAVTDAQGLARLRAPAGETGLAVRVLGPHCVVRVVEDVSVPTGTAPPLVVVADPGGTVLVRVRGGEALAAYRADGAAGAMVALTPYSVPLDRHLAPDTCWPLGADGLARIEGITAGSWDVRLLLWVRPSSLGQVAFWNPLLPHQTVSFERGETREVEFDGLTLAPARLTGRVVMAGEPLAHAPLTVSISRPREQVPRVYAVTDADGRFELASVMPGQVHLQAEQLDPATGRSVWLGTKGASPRLPPGGVLEHEFVVDRR